MNTPRITPLLTRLLSWLGVVAVNQWLCQVWLQPLWAQEAPITQLWLALGARSLPGLGLAAWWLFRWASSGRGQTRAVQMASACLGLGLGLGALVMQAQLNDGMNLAQARFERLSLNVAKEVEQRMALPLRGLRSLSAFALHDWKEPSPFARDEFRRFVLGMNLETEYPGVKGYGWAMPDASERQRWQRQWHDAPLGEREPNDALEQQPAWQEAARSAMLSGQPTLSALMVSAQGESLLSLCIPVYRPGQVLDTIEHRQAAVVGLLYALVEPHALLQGLSSATQGLQAVRLYEAAPAQTRLFSLGDERLTPDQALFTELQTWRQGGRDMHLQTLSTPEFEAQTLDRWRYLLLGMAVQAISLLLAGLLLALSRSRAEALAMAQDITRDLSRAKHDAEMALRDSQALLDTLNRHALVSMADPQGRIIYANDEFCAISGYSRDELLGQDHRIVNSGTHPRGFWQDMWEALAQGEVWTNVICNRRKNGQLYWVKSTVAALRDEHGQVLRYVSVRTDVTTQRQVEEALMENTERLDLALEGGTDGLWDRLDTYGEQEWWSPQFFRLLGLEPGEVEPSVSEFDRRLHPDDQFATLAALEAALEHDKPYDVEFRLMTKSGGYRWFRSRAKVFRDEFHSHRRIAGSLQDIHELKLNQAVLKEQSERLSRIFALSPDGFAALDAQQRVCYVSPRFIELSGMPLLKCLGLDAAELLNAIVARHGSAADCRSPNLEELRLGPATLPLKSADGRDKVLHAALHEDVGQSLPGMLQLRDVSRERELDRLKTEFLTTAAHELRTPMVSIYGFSELMMTRELPPEKMKQFMGKIFRQSQVMMNITTELLDLTRLETQKGSNFAVEAFDLCELLRTAAMDYNVPEGREHPVLDLQHPRPRQARVDSAKLTQVVHNVLSNAYKYSREGEVRIRLIALEPSRQLRIEISDQGIGMTSEQLARVTERFYRADPSGHLLGTGLGMSIALEIVTQMGGELHFQSEPGQGTTVSIVFDWLNP